MSLTALNWKRLPNYTIPSVSGSSINGILDSIFTLFTTGSYYDGTPRTTGSNSAWRFFKFAPTSVTEAVYGYPPTITSISQSVIFAGTGSVPTVLPKMVPNSATTTAAIANCLLLGTSINSSTILHWTSQSIFVSGSNTSNSTSSFSGYGILSGTAPTTTGTKFLYGWECQEAIAFQVVETSSFGGGAYCGLAGAFIDPESSDRTVDSFTDGRIYGVATTGTTSSVTFLNLTNDFLNHNVASVNSSKFAYLQPPTSSITCSVRTLNLVEQRNLDFRFVASSSKVPMLNQYVKDLTNGYFIGRLREIKAIRSFQSALTYRSSSIDIGYTLAARDSGSATTGSCILLMT